MKRLILSCLILTIIPCVLFSTVTVFAGGNEYVAVRGGVFEPNDESPGLTNFDTGSNIEFVYGSKVNPNFAIEGGIGGYSCEFESAGITYTASAVPITVTAKGIIPIVDGQIEIYGGAGLGIYFNTYEIEFIGSSWEDDGSAVGFHLVGGVDFSVSDNIAIGGEVKWVSVEQEVDFGFGTVDVEWGGTIFNIGLTYKF